MLLCAELHRDADYLDLLALASLMLLGAERWKAELQPALVDSPIAPMFVGLFNERENAAKSTLRTFAKKIQAAEQRIPKQYRQTQTPAAHYLASIEN